MGHFGAEAIMKEVWRQGLSWPNMKADVVEVVKGCQDCQQYNIG